MTGTLILLAILKTIGSILLGILAVLLVLLLLVLFVPVHYHAEGRLRDQEGGQTLDPGRVKEALQAEFRVFWLFHLVRLSVSWKENDPFVCGFCSSGFLLENKESWKSRKKRP